jgi:hypothetical protein
MSNAHDSEAHRNAIEKAFEGNRLLGAGDYEGAIAACDEAIQLIPDIAGARRTKEEAT